MPSLLKANIAASASTMKQLGGILCVNTGALIGHVLSGGRSFRRGCR
jgi:hypothetical protein